MATLTGNKVKDTYESLLKLSSGSATSTLKTVEDGAGNSTALKVSTDAVEVAELLITNTPTLSSDETTVLVYDDADNTVKSRNLGTAAFTNSVTVDGLYARTESNQLCTTTPTRISFNTIDNTLANGSFQTGSGFTLADSNRNIVVGSDGGVRLEVALYVYFTNNNSNVIISLKQGATTVVTASRQQGTGGTYNVISFNTVVAANAADTLSVEVSSSSDGVTVQSKSLVMAMTIFDGSFV
jgi:hypothetical protein